MHDHHLSLPLAGSTTFRDPVCGMTVDPATAPASAVHDGTTYYFCNPGCARKFNADPKRYLDPGAAPEAMDEPAPTGEGVEYICPMDPEVRSDKPGSCPKCGMALEPRAALPDEGPSPEFLDFRRRFVVGLVLLIPLLVMHFTHSHGLGWLQFVLATPVVLWCGWPFFHRARVSVARLSPNMFTLIGLGVGAAYLFSIAALVWPDVLGEAVYFESAAAIVVLVLLGQLLELWARRRTSAALRNLLSLTPKTARLVGPAGEQDVPVELIQPGDSLRVRPGERVPVDGVVTEGASAIDESMISGEPLPVAITAGSKVHGGTMNGTGGFLMTAEKVGADTLLAGIVRLVTEAQRSRAPVQRLVDRVAAVFVPAVLLISILTFVLWLALDPSPNRLTHAIGNAVAVLIIACPCALGLATPMAILVGVGRGAEQGVLIRDAAALERLHAADTLLVDKTGTLTEGKPTVTAVEPQPGFTADDLLRLAAAVERGSEHPLASALVRAATERGLTLANLAGFRSEPGKGVVATVEGRTVVVGTSAFLGEQGADVTPLRDRAEALRTDGQTVLFVAADGRPAGVVGVSDPIRTTTPEALRLLRDEGLHAVMLTGDSPTTAGTVARKLGIDEVIAGVLPAAKAAEVERLQKAGRVVAMAGDGSNDAPALAKADVGIALGTGTDLAMESASVTLVSGDLRAIARARRLSRLTLAAIRQNLFLAFVYNTLAIPLAAVGLLSPVVAGAAMSLSSVSVIGNSLRLRRQRL